jgi:hypothetical protein
MFSDSNLRSTRTTKMGKARIYAQNLQENSKNRYLLSCRRWVVTNDKFVNHNNFDDERNKTASEASYESLEENVCY